MSDTVQASSPPSFSTWSIDYCSGLIDEAGRPPARGHPARERRGAATLRRLLPAPHRDPVRGPRGPGGRCGRWSSSRPGRTSRAATAGTGRAGAIPGPGAVAGWIGVAAGVAAGDRHVAAAAVSAGRIGLGRDRGPSAARASRRRERRLAGQCPGLPLGGQDAEARAGTCGRQGRCAWNEGWPRSSSTAARGSSSRDRPASSSSRRARRGSSTAR